MRRLLFALLLIGFGLPEVARSQQLELRLRDRVTTSTGSSRFHVRETPESWDPRETALIVCDVWDAHHCLRAVQRVGEMGPRLNEVIHKLRQEGVTVIHAPSDCMAAYAEHPARMRAMAVPTAERLPEGITQWCRRIPSEEHAEYPVDQSDGGEDDEPAEHADWHRQLEKKGRNPKAPWKKQADVLEIDGTQDYLTDKGDEVWSILESRGIKNVILAGVHTNMCVLGRPFGLRQMSKNGKHVVLMRDLTDTMYNPARWPRVSHFSGTDLIVEHIEKYVCPTITSDQLLGGRPFRFQGDRRPHLVLIVAEDEYKTEQTLPQFASEHLNRDFRITFVFGNETQRNDLPGLDVIDQADVILVSARRRVLKPEQMDQIRRFVLSGKPVLGIRTASHAWSLRQQSPPEGFVDFPEWDAQVFGGSYTNHYPSGKAATVWKADAPDSGMLLKAIAEKQTSSSSLYKVSPLAKGARPLLWGKIDGEKPEPVAWTFTRSDGGKSFYTSLGSVDDFADPSFRRLLLNAVYWSVDIPPPDELPTPGPVPERKI